MRNPFDSPGLMRDIESWNGKFPFDLLWRMKYKIPFGSPEHRQMEFFDIKYDILEERYIQYISSVKKYGDENQKQLLKKQKLEEIDEEQNQKDFDDLDLDQFDEQNNVTV